MSQDFSLIAQKRVGNGKAAARRLRREGLVPAILYGTGGDPEPLQIAVNHVRKQLENEAFYSHILTVSVDGKDTQAVLRAVQRDPATSQVTHLDLLRVSASHEITMNVPLHFSNEETAPGKRDGGVFSYHIMEVQISCLPKDLPEYLEVDLGALEIGDAVHLSEVKLPEGVSLLAEVDADHDQPVVSVQHAQKLDVEPEEEGEEALAEEAEAPEEGEEAASSEESED